MRAHLTWSPPIASAFPVPALPPLHKVLIPATVLLLGGAATCLAVVGISAAQHTRAHAQFTREADDLEAQVRRRLSKAQDGLQSLRAAHAMRERLSPEDLRLYVARRDMALEFPGLRGFGMTRRLSRPETAAMEADERAAGRVDFSIRTPGDLPQLYVIQAVEPAASNAGAAGYDAGSNPTARAAIEHAVASGMTTLSAPVKLQQDRQGGLGYVLYMPVYLGEPRSEDQRIAALDVVLFAPFVARELLADVGGEASGRLGLRVHDAAGGPPVYMAGEPAASGAHTTVRTVLMGGRTLNLEITDQVHSSERGAGVLLPWTIGIIGAILTLLLAAATLLLAEGRLQALARLARRERLLHTITDNVPAAISYWDAAGRCRFANLHTRVALGLPPDGTSAGAARSISPQLMQAFGSGLGDVRSGTAQRFEHVHRAANGDALTWDVHLMPDLENGRVQGWFAFASDVTELHRARDLALEASRAKTQFLSNMSHEIRTPMNAILGMLTLLRGTSQSTQQRDYTAKAEGAARSLLSLLNDVLDIAKIEAGRMELDCRAFSLEALLRDMSVILSANIGDKPLEVLYDLDPRVPDGLVGDDMRLRQILINLGGNAVKFTERGQVVVRTRLLAMHGAEAEIAFDVTDSGIGISNEDQQRLFRDFVQATGARSRRYGGSGLGLGICQRLIELMGGSLRVQSVLGRGSTFSFGLRLPLAPRADAGGEPLPRLPSLPRVLFADDNALARSTFEAMARGMSWQADAAASVEEALVQMARAHEAGRPYDAVFLDWRLVRLDAKQAAVRIRALTPFATPRLVMVTARGSEVQALAAGDAALVDDWLVKPVTPGMLRDALAAAVLPRSAAVPAPGKSLQGLRLLVAEDNAINQQIALELLRGQGAQVDLAVDGQQAVERLTAGTHYDCVLMDMLMPVMDGLQATRHVREVLGLQVPIVAVTANALDVDRVECLAAGMDGHIAKPFSLDEVVATVRGLLQQGGLRRS